MPDSDIFTGVVVARREAIRKCVPIVPFIASCVGASLACAAGLPPIVTQRSPETVNVDLNAGQDSFECTGTAIDFDSFDTLYISTAILPTFMTLDTAPGNPASFVLHAENLTGANYGGYIVDVFASDSPNDLFNATSVRFGIGMIPEPGSGVALLFRVSLLRRRRTGGD